MRVPPGGVVARTTPFGLNLIVAVVLTVPLRAMGVDEGNDGTTPQDYHADVGDAGVDEELDPGTPVHA